MPTEVGVLTGRPSDAATTAGSATTRAAASNVRKGNSWEGDTTTGPVVRMTGDDH
jgi:hypothetical protein